MKKKNANIELLRMISMFVIIMHHAVLYSDILTNNTVSFNKYIAGILYIGGKYGANIFFAITAYFLIDKPFRFRRIISVWETTFFYGILFMILNLFVGFRTVGIRDICETLFPVCYKSYWFVTAYVGLILLSPFLNLLIDKLEKRAYLLLLIFMMFMLSIPVTFLPGSRPYADESHLLLCIFIYLFIGFYKKEKNDKRIPNIAAGGAFLGFLWMALSAVLIITINNATLNRYITYWMNGESLPMLMFSLGTSIYVFDKPLRVNSFVENISKGTFDIYLIHMNHFVYIWLWNKLFKIERYYNSGGFLIEIFGVSLIVFCVCLTVGNIRKDISDYIHTNIKSRKLDSICERIDLMLKL